MIARMTHIGVISLLIPILLFSSSSVFATDELIIGVFPRRDATLTNRMFTPLKEYLSEQLRRTVKLETAANFEVFMSRVRTGRYDLIHLNQYQYIQIHESHGYEVIAQNEEQSTKSIRGAIFVKTDSPISDISELKGKTIVFGGGKNAMMSYIVPTYLLQKAGLQRNDYKEQFAISPPNSLIAVYLGHADAGGAGEIVQRLKVVNSRIPKGSIKPLIVSEPLAHLPWAASKNMSDKLKNRVKQLLIGLSDTKEGRNILSSAGLTGINPASNSDYDTHRIIIDQVNPESSE